MLEILSEGGHIGTSSKAYAVVAVFFVCVRFELIFGIQLSVASLLLFLREGVFYFFVALLFIVSLQIVRRGLT